MQGRGRLAAPIQRSERALFVQWGAHPIQPLDGVGDTAAMDQGLRETVKHGGYVIDTQAVAAAMLSRERIRSAALGVLVAPQSLDLRAVCLPDDDSAAVGDAA
jgi:hypothetical protein